MATKKAASKKSSKTTKKVVKKVEATKQAEVKVVKKTSESKNAIIETIAKPSFIAPVLMELIGTFLLTAGVITGRGQPLVVLFVLLAVVLIAGRISGAHVNPLITIGAWTTRRINTLKATFYVAAQFIGAMLAFVLLNAFVGAAPEISQAQMLMGETQPTLFSVGALPKDKEILVLAAEIIGSFIFAFAVATVSSDKKKTDGAVALGVGSGLFIAALIAGSLAEAVNGSTILNPAVAVALKAFTGENQNVAMAVAIYVGAAILGGILGFLLSTLISKANEEEK